MIAGHAATLYRGPSGQNTGLEAVVDLGNVVIWAIAVPLSDSEQSGPLPNPLSDEQTFLNVLQDLRPYPR